MVHAVSTHQKRIDQRWAWFHGMMNFPKNSIRGSYSYHTYVIYHTIRCYPIKGELIWFHGKFQPCRPCCGCAWRNSWSASRFQRSAMAFRHHGGQWFQWFPMDVACTVCWVVVESYLYHSISRWDKLDEAWKLQRLQFSLVSPPKKRLV